MKISQFYCAAPDGTYDSLGPRSALHFTVGNSRGSFCHNSCQSLWPGLSVSYQLLCLEGMEAASSVWVELVWSDPPIPHCELHCNRNNAWHPFAIIFIKEKLSTSYFFWSFWKVYYYRDKIFFSDMSYKSLYWKLLFS